MKSSEGFSQHKHESGVAEQEVHTGSFDAENEDVGVEALSTHVLEVEHHIDAEHVNFLPEAENRISATAQSMNVSPETFDATRREFGLDEQLRAIQQEEDVLRTETSSAVNRVVNQSEESIIENVTETVSQEEITPNTDEVAEFEHSNLDPDVQAVEQAVLERTNRDIAQMQSGVWGNEAARRSGSTGYVQEWGKSNDRISMRAWDDFVRNNPDKAKMYRGENADISAAIERAERRAVRQRQDEQLKQEMQALQAEIDAAAAGFGEYLNQADAGADSHQRIASLPITGEPRVDGSVEASVTETKSEIASVAGETLSEQASEIKEKTPEELKAERRTAILNFKGSGKPVYEKRFQIPEDISIKERLKGVQNTMRDFQSQYPEALSFTMYGSMVKNTARLESDIDGTLFVDVTPTGNEEFDTKVLADIESGQYLGKFKTELQNRLGLTPEQVGKDVKLETISESDITNAAEIYMLSNELYKEEIKAWENSRRDTGKTEETPFGKRPVYEYDGEKPKPPSLPDKISAMFNLDIGGGIRKYREQFLKSLESLEPEQADDICRNISAYLSFSEGGKRNERTKLPHIYDEFKKTYLKL